MGQRKHRAARSAAEAKTAQEADDAQTGRGQKFLNWVFSEKLYAFVLVLVGAALTMIPWEVDRAQAESRRHDPPGGLVLIGDNFDFGAARDYVSEDPDMNNFGGNYLVRNDSDHAISIVTLIYRVADKVYAVKFGTTGNCDGRAFTLQPQATIAMQVFVPMPGKDMVQTANDWVEGTFGATDAEGAVWPLSTESPDGSPSFGWDVNALRTECSSSWGI